MMRCAHETPRGEHMFMKVRKDQRGQAMVESMLIVVLLTIVLFAALQILVVVINDMVVNEAAFSAARASAVTSGEDARLKEKTGLVTLALLSPHYSSGNLLTAGADTTTTMNNDYCYYSKGGSVRLDTEIDYTSRILFPSLVRPGGSKAFPGNTGGVMRNTARARMIKSPDEEYYDKAYFGARLFND